MKALWTKVPGAVVSRKRECRPVRRVSKKRRKDYAEWKRIERAALAEHPMCQACPRLSSLPPRPSVDGHHLLGRSGSLYTNRRFIIATCRECHDRIHSERKMAIALNLIGGPGEWGNPNCEKDFGFGY